MSSRLFTNGVVPYLKDHSIVIRQHQDCHSICNSTRRIKLLTTNSAPLAILPNSPNGSLKNSNADCVSDTPLGIDSTAKKPNSQLEGASTSGRKKVTFSIQYDKVFDTSAEERNYTELASLLGVSFHPMTEASYPVGIETLLLFVREYKEWMHKPEPQQLLGEALLQGRFAKLCQLFAKYPELAKIRAPRSTDSEYPISQSGPILLVRGVSRSVITSDLAQLACHLLDCMYNVDSESFSARYYDSRDMRSQSLFQVSESFLANRDGGKMLNEFRHKILTLVARCGVRRNTQVLNNIGAF